MTRIVVPSCASQDLLQYYQHKLCLSGLYSKTCSYILIGLITLLSVCSSCPALAVDTDTKNQIETKLADWEIKSARYGFKKTFLEVAFVKDIFYSSIWPRTGKELEFAVKSLPFLAEYVSRSKGLPDLGVLNKWSKKTLTVKCGLPAYTAIQTFAPIEVPRSSRGCSQLENAMKASIDEINKAEVIKFIFIDSTKEEVEPVDIRIVPSTLGTVHEPKYNGYIDHTARFERSIVRAVHFTVGERYQVEGYFIPKANNSIGAAICHIVPGFEPDVLQSYISECLLRSLGLPTAFGGNIKLKSLSSKRLSPTDILQLTDYDIALLNFLYDDLFQSGDSPSNTVKKIYNLPDEKIPFLNRQ